MDMLAAMETFTAVVDSGSFSAAARRLGVGQPAVSKTIAQLEEKLAVHLLIRSTRGLTPTEAGLAFYEGARRTLSEANEAQVLARGSGSGLTGRLRICAAVTFASLHLVPRLGPFMAAHPDLQIEVVLDDRAIDLVEEGIDVALRMGNLADSSLVARKITSGKRMVVATPAYIANHGRPQSPAELASHQAVIYSQRDAVDVWRFNKDGNEQQVKVQGQLKVSAAQGQRAAVLAGLGVTLASQWMFPEELASGAVEVLLPDWQLPPVDLWAVFPAGRNSTTKARLFVEFVQGLFEPPFAPPVTAPIT
ncbi:LysR family transcriptional regulator [Gallaecimonas pentaromativorans]|uniref:LysR family transcriptional regulator n=1 Tax=Gallaecimonas pentaromativorans TaxID=584787 RepID=UPI003A8F4B31